MQVKKSEFSLWLCGDGLRSSQLTSVGLSFLFCKMKRRDLFALVAHQYPSRTSASTWEKLPGGKVSLSGRKEGSFKIKVTFLLTKRIFMQKAFQMSLKQRAEMNLKCLTYAFSALSSNYDNLGGYVNYTILVKWHNYEMLGQKQKRITLL